jgi:hypothetical protein
VTASNNSGLWNDAGTFLDFSVAPAYYQATWFRALMAGAVLMLLTAMVQLRARHMLRQHNMRFDERVAEGRGSHATCTTPCCRASRAFC